MIIIFIGVIAIIVLPLLLLSWFLIIVLTIFVFVIATTSIKCIGSRFTAEAGFGLKVSGCEAQALLVLGRESGSEFSGLHEYGGLQKFGALFRSPFHKE